MMPFHAKQFNSTGVDFIWTTVQVYPNIPCQSLSGESSLYNRLRRDGSAGPLSGWQLDLPPSTNRPLTRTKSCCEPLLLWLQRVGGGDPAGRGGQETLKES